MSDGGEVQGPGPDAVPRFAPGVRLGRDRARDRWVLLAPERVVVPDAVCLDVLRRIDGRTPLRGIVQDLCAEYTAPSRVVARDVAGLVAALHGRGWVVMG
ncbi:MAG: pyrroloquinoline quinone biosynthesis peptide chaperone PqqD [Myxococcota bacterium]